MTGVVKNKAELVFEGSNFFRQRLTLATLTGQPIRIQKIRIKDTEPGLKGKKNSSNLLSKSYLHLNRDF